MPFDIALRMRLLDDEAVVAAAGKTRGGEPTVDWDERPEQSRYPAVVLEGVTGFLDQHMTGFQAKRRSRIQINVLALNATDKVTLRDAVIAAVPPRSTIAGVRFERIRNATIIPANEQSGNDFIHRDIIDAVFWYTELET